MSSSGNQFRQQVPVDAGVIGNPQTGAISVDQDRNKALAAIAQQLTLLVGGSVILPVKTVSTAYTANTTDYGIEANATGAAFAVTLPANATVKGKVYAIKKSDSSGNAVTITAVGGDLIDGSATFVLSAQYKSVMIQSDGSGNWLIYAKV